MSTVVCKVYQVVLLIFHFIAGNLDGIHLTLTAFSKELSAPKIYQDVPVSVNFHVSFSNQGT